MRDDVVSTLIAGGAVAAYGLTRRGLWGYAAAGCGLAFIGVAARLAADSEASESGPANANRTAGEQDRRVIIEKTVTVNRTPAEAYEYWRQLEHLPSFMSHVKIH